MLIGWLWSLVRDCETDDEVKFSFALLEAYLESMEKHPERHRGHIGNQLIVKFREYLLKSFQFVLPKLSSAYYSEILTLLICTSTWSEIENSSLKRSQDGPRKCHDLAESHDRISGITDRKDLTKRMKSAYDLDSVPANSEQREQAVTELTQQSSNILMNQYHAKDKYNILQVDPTSTTTIHAIKSILPQIPNGSKIVSMFLLTRNVESQQTYARDDINDTQRVWRRMQWVNPSILRTRVLVVLEYTGGTLCVCSCKHFKQMGHCCRQVYAVTGLKPNKTHAQTRFWKIYMKLQEDSIAPELKQAILRMQQASEKLPGTPVLEPRMWINTSHPKASNNLPFLQEMLDRVKQVRIRLTDSFWNTQQGQSILVQVHAGKRHYGWTSDMPLPPLKYSNKSIQSSHMMYSLRVYTAFTLQS
ncbi:hypothetical protein SEMRO_3372_G347360.1 [Seminavis robusta]|uniref:SWIM-type domain-containing protein n=1 Tax=Seminavis robusta TaxID=568900 RepID=A0A9N8HZ90_9STRA|nr:hypothetical protein SEMRO_3372_G347360.1 [Seminavis robusta]|eukprot:Sro3372_g347360.1 n/a (417) ;mRNA; f:4028-5278